MSTRHFLERDAALPGAALRLVVQFPLLPGIDAVTMAPWKYGISLIVDGEGRVAAVVGAAHEQLLQ